jgi:hypothetical protein
LLNNTSLCIESVCKVPAYAESALDLAFMLGIGLGLGVVPLLLLSVVIMFTMYRKKKKGSGPRGQSL